LSIFVILSQLVSELPVPDLFLCLCNGNMGAVLADNSKTVF